MLHQIRKMVGLVIAIMRGVTAKETVTKAWGEEKLDLPVAPGVGLVLEEVIVLLERGGVVFVEQH